MSRPSDPLTCPVLQVKLHPTSTAKADEVREKLAGTELLTPPFTRERLVELGELETRELTVAGEGWMHAGADVVLAGVGWFSVTGTGQCRLRVHVPRGTYVGLREPLMPFEARQTTSKATGGRIIRKSELTRQSAHKRRRARRS